MAGKADLLPGSARIDTLDVPATQRHFVNIELSPACRLTAADVNDEIQGGGKRFRGNKKRTTFDKHG